MEKKKKEFAAFVLAWLFAALAVLPVHAASSTVSYEGGAEQFVLIPSDGNLFPDFAGVMPGDSLTQVITVRNGARADGGVKQYLRGESTDETVEGFLEQMTLVVRQGNTVLSEDTAEKTAGLTENILLGHFTNKGEITLEVTLHIPIEMDNRFQEAAGKLTWVFTAEELDAGRNPSGGGGSSGGGNGSGSGSPGNGTVEIGEGTTPLTGNLPDVISQIIPETIRDALAPLAALPRTGDGLNTGLWAFLAIVSVCALAGLVIVRKRMRKNSNR